MRHRILLAAAFLYLAAADMIWIARDTRPPFWDMAGHGSGAVHVYDAFANSGLRAFAELASRRLTGYYPPLYHSAIAALWSVFGKTVNVARTANLIPVALLLLATFAIGKFLYSSFTAAVAAVLVSFFPLLLWLSREMILDYWLAAMVALSFWLLLKTRDFSHGGWSILFGLAVSLGMLTKWTYPFFLFAPALWCARRNWRNAAIALGVALPLTLAWYIPAIPALREFFQLNTAGGVFESDPQPISFPALVFYLRALEGYQLFFPLFAAFVIGAIMIVKRPEARWIPVLLWIVGGWLGLLLFQNKDPRYSVPLLPAVALVSAPVFTKNRALTVSLLVFLGFQHYLVSFGIRSLPDSIVLMKGSTGQLSWNWYLYQQEYFALWGPPRREDWKVRHVLSEVTTPPTEGQVRLGLVPDIPRFDSQAFQFYIDLDRTPVELHRVGVFDERAIADNDYLLIAERDLEHDASFAPDSRIAGYVASRPASFQIAESFPLPNGDVIRLYRVTRQ